MAYLVTSPPAYLLDLLGRGGTEVPCVLLGRSEWPDAMFARLVMFAMSLEFGLR